MLLLTFVLFAASGSVGPRLQVPVLHPAPEAVLCPDTPMSLARKLGSRAPKAIPLSKLPPAQTFMAVDREIDHCPAPLTMTQYRRGARR